MILRIGIVLLATAALFGCGNTSNQEIKSSGVPRGKPAHLRFVNLSSESASAKVGVYSVADLRSLDMSSALPVSPGKSYTAEIDLGDKKLTETIDVKPAQFATIVFWQDRVASFVSGQSLSKPRVGIADFVNLTKGVLTFEAGGKFIEVQPMDSETLHFPAGSVSVKVDGADVLDVDLTPPQFWSIYAFEQGGRLQLKSASLKGTGQAVGTGPS